MKHNVLFDISRYQKTNNELRVLEKSTDLGIIDKTDTTIAEVGDRVQTKLVTFDIFDTLLTRISSNPTSVFYFVGTTAYNEKLLYCSPENYVKYRIEAEQHAREGQPAGEVDDERIFNFLINILGVNKAIGARLRDLELEWEVKLIRPVPFANEMVLTERSAGYTIAFVSDMYWKSEVLISLLKLHNFWQDDDQLWVSSEHQASKTNSELFKKVLRYNSISIPGKIRHFGNNKSADVDGAKRIGLSPVFLPEANPNRREDLLGLYVGKSGGITSILAGSGKILRLNYQYSNTKEKEIARIIGNVVGPSFTLYILWVLRKAKFEGIKKLFFISRDGYVPYIIAKELIENLNPDIKVSYLYGSRQAWHIAGLQTFDEESFEWMFVHAVGATAASVLMRVGIDWLEFVALYPTVTERITNPFAEISSKDMDYIKSIILSNSTIQDYIIKEAGIRKSLLQKYLEQENFSYSEKIGMIEIGWSGRTRKSFERAIGKENAGQLHWFYLGLHKNIVIPDFHRVHFFLFGPSLNYRFIDSLAVVAESFCLAPHGSLLSLEDVDGTVVPYFKENTEASYDQWGRAFYLKAIEEYCKILPVSLINNHPGNDLRSPAYHILQHFAESPLKEDGEIFGSLPFEHDQFGAITFTLAPKVNVNIKAIKEALTYGSLSKAAAAQQLGAWGAGAWVARGSGTSILKVFAFIGFLRVNWKSILKKSFTETKIYIKKIIYIESYGR